MWVVFVPETKRNRIITQELNLVFLHFRHFLPITIPSAAANGASRPKTCLFADWKSGIFEEGPDPVFTAWKN